MIMANGGAAAAAAAAAAERLRQLREEEEMTAYNPRDLAEDWEFKILRANTRVFRDPKRLREILDYEKRGGWVFVEKFDDQRIRLKRPAATKAVDGDFQDGYDPYRTTVGITENMLAGVILASIFGALAVGLIVLMVFLK
jgi:hypothetical protein